MRRACPWCLGRDFCQNMPQALVEIALDAIKTGLVASVCRDQPPPACRLGFIEGAIGTGHQFRQAGFTGLQHGHPGAVVQRKAQLCHAGGMQALAQPSVQRQAGGCTVVQQQYAKFLVPPGAR